MERRDVMRVIIRLFNRARATLTWSTRLIVKTSVFACSNRMRDSPVSNCAGSSQREFLSSRSQAARHAFARLKRSGIRWKSFTNLADLVQWATELLVDRFSKPFSANYKIKPHKCVFFKVAGRPKPVRSQEKAQHRFFWGQPRLIYKAQDSKAWSWSRRTEAAQDLARYWEDGNEV